MIIEDLGQRNTITHHVASYQSLKISIKGNDNTITIGNIEQLKNLNIKIWGNGGTIHLENLKRIGHLELWVKNGGHIHIKELTTIGKAFMEADNKKISIGQDCMISFDVSIRTTDSHGIYNLHDGSCRNPCQDVIIHDHVWISQGSIVSKSVVEKNSIIGARSFVHKKKIPSHCIAAGSPAKIIANDIIWDREFCDNIYEEDATVDTNLWRWIEAPKTIKD